MASARTWVLGAVLVAACSGSGDQELNTSGDGDGDVDGGTGDGDGDGDGDEADFQAGSRLGLRFYTSADGLSAFETLIDTEFDAPCQALLASDGKWRCLPNAYSAYVRYLDAECTEPVIYEADSACPLPAEPRYYAGVTGTCPTRYEAYTRGAAVTPLPAELYDDSSGTCTVFTPPAGTLARLTKIAPADLVELVPELGLAAGKLAARYFAGADGSRVFAGYFDTALELACLVQDFSGTYRCAAGSSGFVDTARFADAACMTPTVTLYGCDDPTNVLEYEVNLETCGTDVTVHALGAELETTYLMSSTCMESTPPVGGLMNTYALGAEVAASSFQAVEPGQQGGTRLVAKTFRHADLPEVLPSPGAFHDLELDLDCTPRAAADGKERCLPTDYGEGYYLDDGCTQLVVGTYLAECADAPTVVTSLPRYANFCTIEESRVYTIGGSMAAPAMMYRKTADGCEVTAGAASRWFAVTAERPLADFAEVGHRMD